MLVASFVLQQELQFSILCIVLDGLIILPAQAASLQQATTNSRSPGHVCGLSASRIAVQHCSVSISQQFLITSAGHPNELRHFINPSDGDCAHGS